MRRTYATQRAYLVRCWREGESTLDRKPVWRFSVEEVLRMRRRWGFDNLAGLTTFLRDELERGVDDAEFEIQDS